ncbi:MAG: D-alanyl-D-alanine carboxypeptidase family protein [Acidimicrobiales bacterium]
MRRRHSLHQAHRSKSHRLSFRAVLISFAILVVAAVGLAGLQLVRGVPSPTLHATVQTVARVQGIAPRLPWPAQGSAVAAIQGPGTMGDSNGQVQYPIASVTKMMTALLVLQKYPLRIGASGPTLTVSPADVAVYQADKAAGDSVSAVVAGEHLTEYQALEALLLPSADNIASLLAKWDAGSTAAFVAKMNSTAKHLGLDHTYYADVSGVNPSTVSTVLDQLKLASRCMSNPVFAQIVDKAQVTLPVAGVQYNVDSNIGTDGIIGVKTGWVPAGGASFVFAARQPSAVGTVLVMGAVFGQKTGTPLESAFAEARKLITSVPTFVRKEQVIARHAVVGQITVAYGRSVPVETAAAAQLLAWPGASYRLSFRQSRKVDSPLPAGSTIGELVATLGSERVSVPVITTRAVPRASLRWRLTRL